MIRLVAWLFVATALKECLAGDYNYKPPITYAGPIVYSDEKPPIISFPGPPAQGYKGGNDNYGYGDSKGPNSITYVPLPLDDLPILIYQSKDKPPIHLINRPTKDNTYGAGSSSYGSSTSGYNTQNYVGSGNVGGYKSESEIYGGVAEGYGSNSNTGGYGSSTSGYGSGGGSVGELNYGPPAPATSSYNAPPPSPKPVYVPKPSTPSAVYMPQVKPQYSGGVYGSDSSYGANSGGYGAYGYYNNVDIGENSYALGNNYGGSMSYNNGGGYGSSSSSSTTSTSSYGSSNSYNEPPLSPPPPPPPHIVYSGHPPIHVYQQPTVYNQPPSNYGSGAGGVYGGGYGGGKPGYSQSAGSYSGKPYNQGYGINSPSYNQKSKIPYAPPRQNYIPAPAGYHKPPIIIYQGIRPPVHVYSEPASSYDKPSYGSSTGSYESAGYGGSYESGAPSYAAYSAKNGDEWEPLKRQESQQSNSASFNEKMDTDIEQEQAEILTNETEKDFTTEQESSSASQ